MNRTTMLKTRKKLSSVVKCLDLMVSKGDFIHSDGQVVVAKSLDRLLGKLPSYLPKLAEYRRHQALFERAGVVKEYVDAIYRDDESKFEPQPLLEALSSVSRPESVRVPRGVYLHGAVGTGKSVLMDSFWKIAGDVLLESRDLGEEGNVVDEVIHELFLKVGRSERSFERMHLEEDLRHQRAIGNIEALEAWEMWLPRFDGVKSPGVERAHFHAFMEKVHGKLNLWRKRMLYVEGNSILNRSHPNLPRRQQDAIELAADDLAEGIGVLCLDEFQVTDVADALILSRLFRRLFYRGVVLVATSNTAPNNLYKDGLNRESFEPFLELLNHRCKTVPMDGNIDFRRLHSKPSPHLYSTKDQALHYLSLTPEILRPTTHHFPDGRFLPIQTAQSSSTLVCEWSDLLNSALGTSDYRHLISPYQTILLLNAAPLHPYRPDTARRLVHFIDEVYEARPQKSLLLHSPIPPDDLIQPILTQSTNHHLLPENEPLVGQSATTATLIDLRTALQRAASRLHQLLHL